MVFMYIGVQTSEITECPVDTQFTLHLMLLIKSKAEESSLRDIIILVLFLTIALLVIRFVTNEQCGRDVYS